MVDPVSIRINLQTLGSYFCMSFMLIALFQGIYFGRDGSSCIAYSGLKSFCSQMEPTTNLLDINILCDDPKERIEAAQAFHYCALFISFGAAVTNILANAGRMKKFQLWSYLCGCLSIISTILCWILLATVQQQNLCKTGSLRDWGWYLGSGFALVVCGSFFQSVGTVTSMILYAAVEEQSLIPDFDTNEEEEAKQGKELE